MTIVNAIARFFIILPNIVKNLSLLPAAYSFYLTCIYSIILIALAYPILFVKFWCFEFVTILHPLNSVTQFADFKWFYSYVHLLTSDSS